MDDISRRVAERHLRALMAADPVRVVLPDGGEIDAADIERMLAVHDLDLREVGLHDASTPNVVRWVGLDGDGHQVHGELRARVGLDGGRAVVLAEITIGHDRRRVFID